MQPLECGASLKEEGSWGWAWRVTPPSSLCIPGPYNKHLVHVPSSAPNSSHAEYSHDGHVLGSVNGNRPLSLTCVCRVWTHTGDREIRKFCFLSGPLPMDPKHLVLSSHSGFPLLPDVPTLTTLWSLPFLFLFPFPR